jgi:tetratricopeptide (TPR) repeat protein
MSVANKEVTVPDNKSERRPRRTWLMRLALAVLAPVVVLVMCELLLRVFSVGYNPHFFVPVPGRDAMTGNEKFGQRFFPVELTQPPLRFSFSTHKAPGVCRVFVLGSSAAAGIPNVAYNFGRVLQVMLEESFPGQKFEVINTAMVAINSHVVREIARECVKYEPDMFVIYMGNNEVVGPYGAGTIFRPLNNMPAIRAGIWLRTTRIGQLLSRLEDAMSSDKQKFSRWQGMEMFMGQNVGNDDPKLQKVYAHFRENLKDICAIAARSGVPVVLCTVPTNLRDCPPFSSLHATGLPGVDLQKWEAAFKRGCAAQEAGKREEAVAAYQEALGSDASYAELQYRLAQCLLETGQEEAAKTHFGLARDFDALRFRADSTINRIIRDSAANKGVSLVDAELGLARPDLSPHGLPGDELFYEHCHLTFKGNYELAALVFRRLVELRSKGSTGATLAIEPPSLDTCAERLVYTDWDSQQAAAKIASMMLRPPFTSQLDSKARSARQIADLSAREQAITVLRLAEDQRIYERALVRKPDDLMLRLNLVRLLNRRNDFKAAQEHWCYLVEALPEDAELRYDYGTVLVRLSELAASETQLREAVRLKSSYSQAHANLGIALAGLGRTDEAIRECRRALRDNPQYATAHENLARLLLAKGKREEAEQHLAEAKRIQSETRGR